MISGDVPSRDAVSIVGLGKLGACMAACMASKGIRVVGIDVNPETVHALSLAQAPTYEPGLAEMLATLKPHSLLATTYMQAIEETDTTFIVVPTPSEPNGAFSLRYVKEAAQGIGRVLRDKKGYHVVAVTSTVLPGSTEYGILPILERESGKKLGAFGLCYSPEFIALGTVIRDFLNPDFVLIGESDQFAGAQIAQIYEQVCDNKPPVARMSIPSAELAKIGLNWALVNKINMANMFGQLAEKVPGANVDDVTRALGMDSRIGPKFLKAAMPASGPCLPRDASALKWLTGTLDVPSFLTVANERANTFRLDRLVREVTMVVPKDGTIAVLGLAYKPGTNVVAGSPGYELACRLAVTLHVQTFDPLVTDLDHINGFAARAQLMPSVNECVRDAHVIVVANPDPVFMDLGDCTGKIVIDPWRIVTGHDGADYRPFGIGTTDEATEARLRKMWS